MKDWLRAHGIPGSKLAVAPNAPGFALPEPVRRADFDARAAGRGERPLRVLFVGRFDWQKGMDRLAAIMTQCAGEKLRIDWRVVGKAVVDASGAAHEGIERFARLEPPVYDDSARAALLAWADVLLMPSRFEGLPLTLLEAQRSGVVPIVTRVGAVEEAATDGVNAIVVSQEACVAEMAAALARLDADRGMLAAMATAAFASARSWDDSARELIARISHARAARDAAEAAEAAIWR
jgi:glycosyltransferase involved in cell wall biosynthesis